MLARGSQIHPMLLSSSGGLPRPHARRESGFTVALSAPRIVLNALAGRASARLDNNICSTAGSITETVVTGLCIDQPLRGTGNHPPYSLDANDWPDIDEH